jgi:hypothetical protein
MEPESKKPLKEVSRVFRLEVLRLYNCSELNTELKLSLTSLSLLSTKEPMEYVIGGGAFATRGLDLCEFSTEYLDLDGLATEDLDFCGFSTEGFDLGGLAIGGSYLG